MSAEADKPDEAMHEFVQEEPRRSREDILREFKLALAIGDGSLLELDQDRARGVNPYDSDLGGRGGSSPSGRGHAGPNGHGFLGYADDRGNRVPRDGKPPRRR